ncbi:MAG: VTT domain-containing protein [Candidatus Izimaplasma sp.]|nr:VTT domain-containing protein [Candidatus Izimaplasma bacterium]
MPNFLLISEVTGFFSFLNPIIDLLESLDHFGLMIYTFFEVLIIIPPIEVIYYPLIQLNVDTWYLYFFNVVIFNVIASALGYFVGKKIGYPILKYFSSDELVQKAHRLFERWGVLAVALGAFTPVPYTIVVFLAGITKMSFKKFIIAGFIGRFFRYLMGAVGIVYIIKEIDNSRLNEFMLIVSVLGMLLFILYYILKGFYNSYKNKQTKIK